MANPYVPAAPPPKPRLKLVPVLELQVHFNAGWWPVASVPSVIASVDGIPTEYLVLQKEPS